MASAATYCDREDGWTNAAKTPRLHARVDAWCRGTDGPGRRYPDATYNGREWSDAPGNKIDWSEYPKGVRVTHWRYPPPAPATAAIARATGEAA